MWHGIERKGLLQNIQPSPLDSKKQFTSDYLFGVKELNATELLNGCIHYLKMKRGVRARHHSGKDEGQQHLLNTRRLFLAT